MIYLDNAATTKPKQEVIDAMMPYFTDKWHNPSSLYSSVKSEMNEARQVIANYINAKEDEIYFTSGGSESNCWAIQGFVNYWKKKCICPAIITTSIEHKSILEYLSNNLAINHHYLSVDKYGFVNEEELIQWLEHYKKYECKVLVSIQMANNEIGTIQMIRRLANITHSYGAVFHTDAVQAFGKIKIDVNNYGIDLMSVSGHKFGCPKGIGFLYIRNGIQIEPLIYGTQERGMRGGTENVPYIIGMKKAVEMLYDLEIRDFTRNFTKEIIHCKAIAYLNNEMFYRFGCVLNGSVSNFNRIHGIMSYRFPEEINVNIEALLLLLDMDDICVSAGSACNSHSNQPSHVLKAIGLSDEECSRTMRISFEYGTLTEEIVNKFIISLEKAIKIMKADVNI